MRIRTDLIGNSVFYDRLVEEVHADRLLYFSIFAYCILTLALLSLTGEIHLASFGYYFPGWTWLFAIIMPAILFALEFWMLAMRRILGSRADLQFDSSPTRMARLAAGILLMQAIGLFIGSFTSIKNAMPVWRGGFPYDLVQADFDKWLHFGVEPPLFLASCCSNARLVQLLELNYEYWFFLVFGSLFFVMASSRANSIRVRFVSVFLLAWVICGNLVAYLFLSAGPIFYTEVTGDAERFAGLMGEFGGATKLYHSYLWQAYAYGKAGIGTGISAFPSVHVAMTVVLAVFAFEYSRWLGLLAGAYAAIILFSSVFLGWHYSIDGYASILIVLAIYFAVRAAAAVGVPDPNGRLISS